MAIDRLPSGSYRLRKMINGKTYTITFEEKPTKKEIEAEIARIIHKATGVVSDISPISFESAALNYIDSKRNVLSQSTTREYARKLGRIPGWFLDLKLTDINAFLVQKVINEYADGHNPKTVRDMNAFISSILAYFDVYINKSINLPQRIKNEPYMPKTDEIQAIIRESIGTRYECAIGLAVCGLRRSEICCITDDDIHDDVVTINKALVEDVNKEWVVKSTKTTESTREVPIPHELAEKIIEQGKAYDGYPGKINSWLTRTQTKLGLPHFKLHSLRHYFASKLITMGFSKREIEVLGGWEKNSQVLESIYSQCMIADTAEGRRKIMSMYSEGLFS